MEKGPIIDRKKQSLMPKPNYTKITLPQPVILDPIILKPFNSLLPKPGLQLSTEVLSVLGIKEAQNTPGIIDSFFACNSCSACKAVSKETLNQIKPEDLTQDN